MPTVARDLNWCQRKLGDAATIGQDGYLWSRAELLTAYSDGYRQLLTLSQAIRRWTVIEVPDDSDGRFVLPRDHERIAAVYYDHRRLEAVEVRELDWTEQDWPTLSGFPLAWTTGLGTTLTFEVYQIPSGAGDTYTHSGNHGIPRQFAGHRTYSGTAPYLGIARVITAADRQYLATVGCLGRPWRYRSSRGNLLVHEVIGPGLADLLATDTPALIPRQMQKYLRYYTLARAWERQGEGMQPGLAALCQQRFERGVEIIRSLGWLSRTDETFQRVPVDGERRGRPQRVQFPGNYPAMWR